MSEFRSKVELCRKWSVREVKDQFSKVLKLAANEGPQVVTRRGKPAVVIVAVDELRPINSRTETPLEFFARLKGLKIPHRGK
jgi:prevent-host-death family protein